MLATYEEGLREQFLERMRSDATVLPSGSDEGGLTWTLRFTEATTFDAAWSELARLGLLGQSEAHPAQRKVTIPRRATLGGKAGGDVLAALGVPEPT
jgi:hypothetical protein